jgi:nucleoside-diphosphate-sugar epimerase
MKVFVTGGSGFVGGTRSKDCWLMSMKSSRLLGASKHASVYVR